MSLESTTTIKAKLAAGLGPKAPRYWSLLQSFLSATISRTEFDEQIRECVDTSPLGTSLSFSFLSRRSNHSIVVQLHNSLIVSIFDPSTHLVAALTPPPDVPKGPPRKRRRLLPYQGPDPDEPITLRSSRLKRWAVGIGRRERDRIRNLKPVALSTKRPPRPEVDEIANERGVRLLSERGGACVSSSSPVDIVSYLPQSFLAVDLQFSWRPLHEASFYNISLTGLISFVLNITLGYRLRVWQLSCHLLLK